MVKLSQYLRLAGFCVGVVLQGCLDTFLVATLQS